MMDKEGLAFETRDCLTAGEEGQVEFRSIEPMSNLPGFDGYSSTFWTVDDRGTFFLPGAFKKTIRERGKTSPVLWNHQVGGIFGGAPDVPIGKHLAMEEDERGLKVSVHINEGTQRGAEVMSALRFGSPIGLSFGFDRIGDRSATEKDKGKLDFSVAPSWVKSAPIEELRGITEVRYWETSPVVFASNMKAKPENVRSQVAGLEGDQLQSLYKLIQEGRLDQTRFALVDQIVDLVMELRAGSRTPLPPEEPQVRRSKSVELEALFVGFDLASIGV